MVFILREAFTSYKMKSWLKANPFPLRLSLLEILLTDVVWLWCGESYLGRSSRSACKAFIQDRNTEHFVYLEPIHVLEVIYNKN